MKKLFTFCFSLIFFVGVSFAQQLGIPGVDFNQNLAPTFNNQVTAENVLTTLSWASLPTSTHAVSRSCCALITISGNDYIFQFGGGAAAGLTTVARFDVTANTWSTGFAPIPSGMSSATAVTIGNNIYLFGGENTAGLGRTYMYDPVANTWTARANMLTLVTDALVVKFNDNYVYVIGGGTGLFGTGYLSAVQLYDVAANTYTACTSYPVAAGMMGGGLIDHTILSAGGWDGALAIANAYEGTINPSDLTQITWTPIANYPTGAVTRMASFPVMWGSFPMAGGFFCTGGAIGGATLTGATNLYNYCTDTWESLTPVLAQARSNFKGCGKMDNVVYVVGGFTTVGVGTSDRATLTDIAGNCIVPVELTSFTATVDGSNVELNWTTATEINNSGFSIERKSAVSDFAQIGFAPGFGTTTEPKSYTFTDEGLQTGVYTYRLKQVDFDGTFEYSDPVEIEVIAPANFSLDQNYPNPFNPSTRINFSLAVDSKVSLKVFDLLGQEIVTLINQNLTAGVHQYDFDAVNINGGVYFYRIEATGVNGSEFTQVRKMVLLK